MLKEKIIGYLCKTVQEESMPEGFTNDDGLNGKDMMQL